MYTSAEKLVRTRKLCQLGCNGGAAARNTGRFVVFKDHYHFQQVGRGERGKVDSNKVHLEMRLCGGPGSITTYIDIETFLWIITRVVSDKFY